MYKIWYGDDHITTVNSLALAFDYWEDGYDVYEAGYGWWDDEYCFSL
jgi:hypothetical protein